jgi:hypothetical protein
MSVKLIMPLIYILDMVIMDDMIVHKRMLKREEGADIVTMKRQAFNDDYYRWPKVNGHVTVPYTTSGKGNQANLTLLL